MNSSIEHPFYPVSLNLPHYVRSTYTMTQILTIFFSVVTVVLCTSYYVISTVPRPSLPFSTRLVFLWFVTCGFIHTFFEGYFALMNNGIAGQTGLLAEMWKEYALSDSRYMSSDSFVVIMETITAAAWGPLSFLIAYAILHSHPLRHLVQLVVSLGQIYGCILYYFTTLFEGSPHCHPHGFYFWFYFVFMNVFWIVIPGILGIQSAVEIYEALEKVGRKEGSWGKEKKRE